VDPKPGVSTSGDMRVVMTPQLALDIFEEWPVVHKAYKDNVPTNVSSSLDVPTPDFGNMHH
jgi:transcription initiation factor TFIIH subunit 1